MGSFVGFFLVGLGVLGESFFFVSFVGVVDFCFPTLELQGVDNGLVALYMCCEFTIVECEVEESHLIVGD